MSKVLTKKYEIRKDIDLFKILPKYGFIYDGNYNRGDIWYRTMDGIDDIMPQNGIVIHGDWDNRAIYFRFPYRESVKDKNILLYIQDLISDGLCYRG